MSSTAPRADRAILARVPRAMGEKLERLAVQNERSLAGEVRVALRRHLADTERTGPTRHAAA